MAVAVKDTAPLDGKCVLNTELPFRNDSFDGSILLKSRTGPGHERFEEYFNARKRYLEISVAGRFLKDVDPTAVIMGCELSVPGQAPCGGFFTKTVAMLLLKLMQMKATVFSCFGKDGNADKGVPAVRAFLTFPLFSLADHLSVTAKDVWDAEEKLGLGDGLFNEHRENIPKQERATDSRLTKSWGPNDVMAFSVHTMYLDLYNWVVVNVPRMSNIALTKFWGTESTMRFVAYTLNEATNEKEYLINVELGRGC